MQQPRALPEDILLELSNAGELLHHALVPMVVPGHCISAGTRLLNPCCQPDSVLEGPRLMKVAGSTE